MESLSRRYARAALDRALEGSLRGQPVRVLSPEDFVLYKILSTRDRDIEDAAAVIRRIGAGIDLPWIEREAVVLAGEIPDRDVLARLARALAALRSPAP